MSTIDTNGMRICWVDTMRYTNPLSDSQSKKWQRLTGDLGVEIFVTSFAPGLRPRRFDEHAHFYLWPALPLAPLRYLTAYLVAPPLVLWLVLTRGIDVLVTHDPYIGAAGALVKNLARLFGRRVGLVVETRGDLNQGMFLQRDLRLKGMWRFLMRRTTRFALRHADVLRAVSNSTREQLQALAPAKPIFQFPSWTDSEVFSHVVPAQPVSERADLVYAGILNPGKGVHILLDAFAQVQPDLPQTRLYVIGKAANPDYAARLHTQVQRLGLHEHVTFINHLPQAELATYMAQGRAVILPSFSEGLPKVVVEAMLCGTPVIATHVGGIPEIVEHGVTGYLVPPGDVGALANAIQRAFSDEKIGQVGDAARQFAMQYYSTVSYIKSYGRLFQVARKLVNI